MNFRFQERRQLLHSDNRVLELIHESLDLAFRDIHRDVQLYQQRIDDALNAFSRRAERFLDEKLSIWNTDIFLNRSRFEQELAQHMVTDFSQPVEDTLKDIGELVSQRSSVQAKSILDFLGDRPRIHAHSMVGRVSDERFDSLRSDLVQKLRLDVKRLLEGSDLNQETSYVRGQVSSSVAQAMGVQLSSATALGGLAFAQALDVTGMVALSSVFALGLVIIPWRRDIIR